MDSILVVDDDDAVLDTLGYLLKKNAYHVFTAVNGNALFSELKSGAIDLVILDVMLGEENGFELAMQIRKASNVPIIFLTGKESETDKVVGLEVGADDFISKPYSSAELLARVKSVLRRTKAYSQSTANANNEIFSFLDWKCDLTGRKLVSPDKQEVKLTSGEFSLLEVFVKNPGRTLSRKHMLDLMQREDTFDRSIDIQVMRLRRKLTTTTDQDSIIQAVRGIGYIFAAKVARN